MRVDRLRRYRRVISCALFLCLSFPLLSCENRCTEIETCVDIASFRAGAREASCASLRNELFMIDRHLVFWQREGTCADASWDRVLFGCTPDEMLCRDWETVGGPMREYADSSYVGLFEKILANRYRSDLGLGRRHEVIPIEF